MAERAERVLGFDPAVVVWVALAVLGCAGIGVAVEAAPMLLLDIVIALAAATVIALRPFESLLVILAARATFVNSVFGDLTMLVGGVLALIAAAPRLPVPRLTVPLAVLLLITLPGVPLTPSAEEGNVPAGYLPVLGWQYLDPPSSELLEWLRVGAIFVVLCLAGWTVRDRRRLEIVVGVIIAGSAYAVFTGITEIATGEYQPRAGFDAINGPFYQSNYYAFYLMVVLTVALVALFEFRTLWPRVSVAALAAPAFVCLVFTYTRAAWVGFALAALVIGLLSYRRLLVLGALALLLGALAFPTQTDRVNERVEGIVNPSAQEDDSWGWRKGEWSRLYPYGLEEPFTGQGFGSYFVVSLEEFGTMDPTYSTDVTPGRQGFAAHNDYLKMFVETGFPGALLWVLFLAGAVWQMWRSRANPRVRGYAIAGVALGAALMVVSISDNIQAYTAAMIYAFAFIGAVAGAARAAP